MGIDFRAWDFFHPWSLWKLHRFLDRSQWFDASQAAEHQARLLRRIVRHAYENVPYYRELFDSRGVSPGDIRGATDLACLPRMNKSTIRRERARLLAANAEQFGPFQVKTSGTTGEPIEFLLDRPANVLEFAYYWRWFGWSGYRLGDRFAELTSSHFLRRPARTLQPYEFQRFSGRLLLNSIELSPARVAEFATAIRRYGPMYLKGTPSAIGHCSSLLCRLGVDDLRFRAVFCTGEMLLPTTRRMIADALRSPVFDSYGHMERTVAICECPAGSLHVNPEYGVLEIDDEVGGNSNTRRGLAIGTGLHCFAMPLLRYETGDVIVYEAQQGRCSCGRAMPRILAVEGRLNDSVVTPDGRVITTLFLVIDQFADIKRGQIVQDGPEHLLVRVAPAKDWRAANEQELVRRLRQYVGEAMRITVQCEPESSLRPSPNGKWRTVISQFASVVGREV
jgi:phenylacetate-CoA ligase